jgi:hypothetical protein
MMGKEHQREDNNYPRGIEEGVVAGTFKDAIKAVNLFLLFNP